MDGFLVGRPAPRLAPFIESYVGYRLLGTAPGLHRGLPSKFATFIVSIGQPIEVVRQTDPSQAPDDYRVVLSGLQATEAVISHDGDQEGVAIELKPAGLKALFGTPARELWDATVEMSSVERAGDELWERVQEAPTWTERFRACDLVLTRLLGLRSERETRPELVNAWELLAASAGTLPIDEVARRVGWSRHYLTRRCRDEFGLGPKSVARVMRFERAHGMLGDGDPPAEVAFACGYFDQAHMNRDFVSLSGLSPARLIAERRGEVPFFQDAGATV